MPLRVGDGAQWALGHGHLSSGGSGLRSWSCGGPNPESGSSGLCAVADLDQGLLGQCEK